MKNKDIEAIMEANCFPDNEIKEGMTIIFTDELGREKKCKVVKVVEKGLDTELTLEEI